MRRDDLCHDVRERLRRLPSPYAAHYGVLPLPPPEESIALGPAAAQQHRKAVEALARLSVLAEEFHDPYVVSRLLSRREAISSSSIEGTNSTLDALLSLEEEAGEDAQDAARQVRDYAQILDERIPQAAAQGPAIFTRALVADLHSEAMRSDPHYEDVPGKLRTKVVWIGGVRDIGHSTYNPPPPGDVENCLDDTVAYLQGGMQMMTQSLITRMAIAHAHFEAVHPFRDGNGRVGRLLLPLMMAAEGQVPLYLSPYIEAHKPAYYASLKAAQQQLDWAAAIAFLADAVTGTVDELMVTRDALLALTKAWEERRRYRRGSAALRALPLLASYPVITVKRLAALLGVSVPAALTAIDQLVQSGILQERTGYSRNRVFVAAEVLSILNRPFGAPPVLQG